MPKEMKLNAFSMCCPIHHSEGQWKNPLHRVMGRYRSVGYWTELAQTLERGFFDSLFLADVHGTYSVYRGSNRTAIEQAVQFPANDPTLVISAMAAATRHLGFACTFSTTYFPPYHTARVFSTLDHLTDGRVAWNVVTSYLSDALANFGLTDELTHDQRYDRADEYMSVAYQLWEHSWQDDAIVADTARDIYIDADRVHQINHQGRWFASVPGPHMCEPSPQRTPVIFQAGASGRGIAFAAKHAEAVFAVNPNIAAATPAVRELREATRAAGRSADDIKIMQGVTVVTAATDEEAQLKAQTLRGFSNPEGQLALFCGFTGIDVSALPPGKSADASESKAIQSSLGYFAKVDPDRDWTLEAITDYMALGALFPKIVGSPQTVADELERWMDETDIDGFNIYPVVQPAGFVDFVDLVVPELQRRRRVRTAYEGATLREHLFGAGQRRLKKNHPAFADPLTGGQGVVR